MPSPDSRVIVACAGSGKTKLLVDEALACRDHRIAVVTYTNNNMREIIQRFGRRNSGVPNHVDVMTWFGFLLRECARPYQHVKYAQQRIDSIMFVNQQSTRYVKETQIKQHYFADGDLIYSDKIAKFVVNCEKLSSGAVARRLADIYTDVFIDEFQDLAGWDLDVLEVLMKSGISVTLVGDPRQHIYSTNPSQKNRQYLGAKMVDFFEVWRKHGLCSIEHMNDTYRCARPICEFSNALWPGLEPMIPVRTNSDDHEGVFLVPEVFVQQYVERFKPRVLRYDKRAKTYGCEALNFGLSKGLEFERVLIIPTGPIERYLSTGTLTHVEKSRDKLYVAITRAWHSVAFVFNGTSPLVPNRWHP